MTKYNNHPIGDCMKKARPIVAGGNAVVLQKFTCSGCGSRQTMGRPNAFYTHGTCEECGAVTDIQKTGCNYMLHVVSSPGALAQLKARYGDFEKDLIFVDCNSHVAENPVRKQ